MAKIRVILIFSILISIFLIVSAIYIFMVSNSANTTNKAVNKTQEGSNAVDSKQYSERETFEMIRDGIKEEEKAILADNARRVSKKTELITLSNCNPDILIAQVQPNEAINFKNSDTVDHTLIIYKKEFKIKAGTNQLIKIASGTGSEIYSYFCDKQTSPSGVVVVKPDAS